MSTANASTAPNPLAAPTPLSMAEVLRIPTLRRLWYAALVSSFGDFLALFAVISVLTFKLHATPRQVVGVQIAYMLPIAILGILAGVFVDRWPLKPTLVGSDLIRCVLCLLLIFAQSLASFYLILAAISVISSFFGPAQGVTIRSIVPLHGLRSANALMQQVMFGMRIIGPFTASFLVASFGPRVCYWADAASFLVSGCVIASLTIVRPATEPGAPGLAPESRVLECPEPTGLARVLADMRVGISFIFHHAGIFFVMLAMASGMFVLGCFGPLIAVYVRDTLHASTRTFGVANAMIGIGMFGGINALTALAKKVANVVLVYGGLAGIAVGLCLLTAVPHVAATLVANLIIGIAVAGIIVPATTMMQQETPPALMGRVGSTFMSLIFAAQICGLVLSGLLANLIGVRHVFTLCAVMLAVLIAAGRLWMEPKVSAATPEPA